VTSASVDVAGEVVGAIGAGLCVLVGVTHADDKKLADRLAEKLWQLRVFEDEEGRMNRSASELDRELLIVSQFTLYADTSRGRRPSFLAAAPSEQAEPLIEHLVAGLVERGARVTSGRFRADMAVTLTNDGPVTIILEV
jgi:D-tyrosyl-tRNA(Tyr) deacylase